jgi:hypothetical protein
LKADILPLTESLDALRNINVYTFNWKDSLSAANMPFMRIKAGQSDFGFIAQELSAAWPYAVKLDGYNTTPLLDDNVSYARVNPARVLPLVMAAIKDMSTIIDQISGVA